MTFEETITEVVRRELRPLLERLDRLAGGGADELLTPRQAAEVAKVQVATIRKWRKDGALKNYGSARLPRYRRSDVLSVHIDSSRAEDPKSTAARILKGGG